MLKQLRDLMRKLDELEDAEEISPPPRMRREVVAVELPQSLEPPPIVAASAQATVFIRDNDPEHAASLAAMLTAGGTAAEAFCETESFIRGLLTTTPALVFLDVCGKGDSAIDALFAMNDRNYRGGIQLMGAEASPVLDLVRHMGERHALQMLPAVRKPLSPESVRRSLLTQDIRLVPAVSVGLGEALSVGSVEFWYQPKIDLRRRHIAGVEVLARIAHPELGVLMPSDFMRKASEADLMRLSRAATEAALGIAARLSEVGIHLPIAVNIPLRALFEIPIIDMVRDTAALHPRWPGLILDVVADQLASDFDLIMTIAPELVANRIQFGIDGLSGGTLTLSKLKELPVGELKLSRDFVAGCDQDSTRTDVCSSLLKLARHLGCTPVAVGIERSAEMHALVAMGCDLGQGYLFGHPMPQQDLTGLLMKRAVTVDQQKPVERPSAAPQLKRAVWR